jgi:putative transposase
MKHRFTDEQIIGILNDAAKHEKTVVELCRGHGISEPTFYAWKRKFGSMSESEAKRLRELEKENSRLKRLLAERELALDVMKEFLEKK